MTEFEKQCNEIVPKMIKKFGPRSAIGSVVCDLVHVDRSIEGSNHRLVLGVGTTPKSAWLNALRHDRSRKKSA